MDTAQRQNRHPRRRLPLILVALLVIFAGFASAWLPSSATASTLTQHTTFSVQQQSQATAPIPGDPAVSQGGYRYFPQTAHFIRGVFLKYWQTHGALPVLGLPLTEPIVEDGLTVQYLERARLEWHSEISDPTQQVLLTRLGAIDTQERGVSFDRLAAGSDTPTSHFFGETGHNLANGFLTYWLQNGGLAVFGYPISEEIREVNQADGREYTVQYFERNRFEWHPEASAGNSVQLGLLGTEYARAHNLSGLARVLLPAEFDGAQQDVSNSPQLAQLVQPGLLEAVQALGQTPQFKWVPAIIVKYNVTIEFQRMSQQDVAGAFIVTSNRYFIVVPQSERTAPVNALASVIAHEATHAYDTVTGALSPDQSCSVEGEVRAFMNGLAAWILLQGNDALIQNYDPGSMNSAINQSLVQFNAGSTNLTFDFSTDAARQDISQVYGPGCSD